MHENVVDGTLGDSRDRVRVEGCVIRSTGLLVWQAAGGATAIATRDVADFRDSPIPAKTPTEILADLT